MGDEGGFAPNLPTHEAALDVIMQAIEAAGYKPGEEVFIALDAASSEFYNAEKKCYHFESTEEDRSSDDMITYWRTPSQKYPIVSIEDGLAEDDWEGWKKLTATLGKELQLVGDDLFVTNVKRLEQGIEQGAGNAILVKVNQIGTLTETIDAVHLADIHAMNAIISHRSGETSDTIIADLAVALNTGQIKTGSASRSDRVSKYNQLLRIEEELMGTAYFPGKDFRKKH